MAEIVQLDQLLKDYLVPGKKIVKYSAENLTEPGENYGSRILALEVRIKNEENEEETLYLAAKMYPENAWVEKIFNSPETFKKEIGLYVVIAEELKKFQKEPELIDIFPKYYGGRLSLDKEAIVGDEAAIFLLENMKKSNYINVDRFKGFDLKTSELIVKKLAIFHATAVALKLKEPEVFQEKIMPFLNRALLDASEDSDENNDNLDIYINYLIKLMEEEFLKEHAKKISPLFKPVPSFYGGIEIREPFATIGHNDAWVNNILVRFENEEPTQIKLVDFQGLDYGSPARDLIFFLFTSVQTPILKQNIDHLIDSYFKIFVDTLDPFGVDEEHMIFTRDEFEKEMEVEGRGQFVHIAFLLTAILRKRGTIKALDEVEEDDLNFNEKNMSDEFQPKILYVISEFVKRNWL